MELRPYAQPNLRSGSAGPLSEDLRQPGEHVLGGTCPSHPIGELRQHLVRGGPRPVHDPVGKPASTDPERLEGDGHDSRGSEGERAIPSAPDEGTDTGNDTQVY